MTCGSFGRVMMLCGVLAVILPAILTAPMARAATAGTIVGTAGVNVRSCPKLSCKVVIVAKLGEALTVTGEPVDGYVPVEYQGKTGYAYYLYLATAETGVPSLIQGEAGCQRIALIFNIGVGFEAQTQMLDWLKAEKIPATLFPMGWWAEENPKAVKRFANDGFIIGSHGDQRMELTRRGDDEVAADIRDATAAIEKATGEPISPYFTPYAAAIDDRVRAIVARAGYLPVGWTVSAQDWDYGVTADMVYNSIMPNIHDGAIVELHLDAPASASSTAIALKWVVAELKRAGYRFVTIPQMAQPCV